MLKDKQQNVLGESDEVSWYDQDKQRPELFGESSSGSASKRKIGESRKTIKRKAPEIEDDETTSSSDSEDSSDSSDGDSSDGDSEEDTDE